MARGEGRKTRKHGTFGTVQKLPSGRHRALYYGPDGKRYRAPTTFIAVKDARGWLANVQADIIRKAWQPPDTVTTVNRKLTFKQYAEDWHKHRPLKKRTSEHYRDLLDDHLLPTFGVLPLASITVDDVRGWYSATLTETPTLRAHAYGLLRTILGSAFSDGKINANPCHIRGAGSAKRKVNIRPATLSELEAITAAMPKRFQSMVLLASWCALRFGELTELRRKDIHLESTEDEDGNTLWSGVIRVRRGVVRTEEGYKVDTPKSDAGQRDVAIPPHLCPVVESHLSKHVGKQQNALLFPADHGGHLAPSTLSRHYYKARESAGRTDLRFHDLRHSGAVLAAATGATLAELMGRLGHSTPQAAMRYQHVAGGRDQAIAALLSKLAAGEK